MAVNSRRSVIFSGISGKNLEWLPNLLVHAVGQNLHERRPGMVTLQRENAQGRIVAEALMTASE